MGTHVLYATSTFFSKPAEVVTQEIQYTGEAQKSGRDSPGAATDRIDEFLRLFADPAPQITPEQADAVEDMIGGRCVRGPRDLRRLIDEAEELYRMRVGSRGRARSALARRLRNARARTGLLGS